MIDLTIGMPCYDDYHGVYFTIQNIRSYVNMTRFEGNIQFVVIDNNPNSAHGKETKKFCNHKSGGKSIVQYHGYTENTGTATAKNQVFKYAQTKYVLCLDCHVILPAKSLSTLIKYYEQNPETSDLIQGPLWLNPLEKEGIHTHFDPVWRGQMYGIWAKDKRGVDPTLPAFEIPMQGMGLFSCRKDVWPGFHPELSMFGPEEGYIHEKFRQNGNKTLCLPGLRWIHRFGRPDKIPYPHTVASKFRNYVIAWIDIGKDVNEVVDHFEKEKILSRKKMQEIIAEVVRLPCFTDLNEKPKRQAKVEERPQLVSHMDTGGPAGLV